MGPPRDDDGKGVTTDFDDLAHQNAIVDDTKTLLAPRLPRHRQARTEVESTTRANVRMLSAVES
jgi:hypothetical protein